MIQRSKKTYRLIEKDESRLDNKLNTHTGTLTLSAGNALDESTADNRLCEKRENNNSKALGIVPYDRQASLSPKYTYISAVGKAELVEHALSEFVQLTICRGTGKT